MGFMCLSWSFLKSTERLSGKIIGHLGALLYGGALSLERSARYRRS